MLDKIVASCVPDAIVAGVLLIFVLISSSLEAMIYALSAAAAAESFLSIVRAYIISEIIKDKEG